MNARLRLWLIVAVAVVGSYFVFSSFLNLGVGGVSIFSFGKQFPLKLGLDLQGGVSMVFEADMSKVPANFAGDALDSAVKVIEKRVNLFGVSEAIVQVARSGSNRRIIVEIPGLSDASAAASLVGKTAQLNFREMSGSASAEASSAAGVFDKTTDLSGVDLTSASVVFSGTGGGGVQVGLNFNSDGAKKFADITRRNVGKPLAIFLDDELLTAPQVQQEIIGGNAVINGNFSSAEAKELSIQLNAGALAVPVKLVSSQQISATLGKESVDKSLMAGVVGLLSVMIFMVLYYGKYGVVADISLAFYAIVVLMIFQTGLGFLPKVTLTLAGIAGFILSIGMAVDANILIFERMKEERRWGHGEFDALRHGFSRAWTSIRDSNISSLITAGILYYFGSGPVRGFALTLAIGVLVSMFSAIFVSRTILLLLIKRGGNK